MLPLLGDAIFVFFAAMTIVGALMAVGLKNIFHNALAFALTLAGTAGIFVFLNSEFLALMQILIYAGASSIAIIFAVMLSPPLSLKPRERDFSKALLAFLVALLVCLSLAYLVMTTPWPVLDNPDIGDYSVDFVGEMLVKNYALAFELISVALLVAIIGALVVARENRDGENKVDDGGGAS
jgi:NADH:ubiquinone oxidoreductase subunit 6 (subunit J)